MTVYFIMRVGLPDLIKIGQSDDLDRRLQQIAGGLEGGIELLAQCDGGAETERVFHTLLQADRAEGEWFVRSPKVNELIDTFKDGVRGRRIWGRLRAVDTVAISSLEEDRRLARHMLETLMGRFGAIQFGIAQEKAFALLAERNPLWTRRRVRAIWERRAHRIDHYEIRDLQGAISDEAFHGPALDAYRAMARGLGKHHRARD